MVRNMHCSSSFGDSQVVAAGIEEAEVSQTPRPCLQRLLQRPARPLDAVEFIGKVVDLENEFHTDRWATSLLVPVVLSIRSPNSDAISLEGQVWLPLVSLIRGDTEAEHAGVEVGCGVQVGREDLKPRRHRHGTSLPGGTGGRPSTPGTGSAYGRPAGT